MPRQPSINREPRWYNRLHANRLVADPGLRAWLLDRGSLTERLIRFSGGHFRVEIISQRMEVPHLRTAAARHHSPPASPDS
ncbi:MAG: hypothetical protein R3E57_11535 [Porticoccaceae bacterium]